jgi:predicted ATPase
LRASQRSVTAARALKHGPSEEFAVGYQALFFHLMRDHERIVAVAEETRRLAERHRSAFWDPITSTYKGWALSVQGHQDEGIALMRDGVARYVAGGHGLSQVHMRTALADALGRAGRWDEAFAALAEAMQVATETGEAFFAPEAYRLRGEFMRQASAEYPPTERASRLAAAESSIREALMMARKQGARSLELRAATSLCLVQRDQRNGAEAEGSQLLARLLASFTEGFDTPDLRDARALLTELDAVT